MRTYSTSVLIVLFLFTAIQISAENIDETTARLAGKNFLAAKNIEALSLQLAVKKVINNETLYYIFNNGSKGFVVVSADDCVLPVLAYSDESSWTAFRDTIQGNNVRGWMESYEKQILDVKINDITATDEITMKWQLLLSGQAAKGTTTVVPPLLTTTWGQGWPYNSLCPASASGPGGHVWVGCVGTAMAQILKYWNYPSEGLGSFGYQWESYPFTGANFNTPYNWSNMPNSTSTENIDISRIMYHAAVSLHSLWGPGGTSVMYSPTEDPMTRAFKNYFKMSSSNTSYMTKSDYTDSQWNDSLQNALLAGRPILYDGDGSMSHSWVCDGVDNSNMYHFNFGWDGTYNGYYSLGNINPGGDNLTNNQHAIWGIKPNDGSTLTSNTTWSGPMSFSTNIWVPDSLSLTLDAGAEIKFAPGCGLYVFGSLVSNGSPENYVKLTASDTTNGWNGIRFDNNYLARKVMADNDSSKLKYTQVEYSQSCGITSVAFGKIVLDHCKINNNHGMWGAGVYASFIPIKISYCEFYNNHAYGQGGGLFVTTTDTLSSKIDHNNLHSNIAAGEGGGFYFMNVHKVVFEWNTSYHNYAPIGAGGAMMYGTMSLTNNILCNNTTIIPGGRGTLHLENYSGSIIDMLIVNNTANGIFCTNSSPSIINTTIANNNHNFGSGIVFDYNSDPYIRNCIIYGNVANNPAYGNEISIWNNDSDPFFDHCNLAGGMNGFGGPGSGTNYPAENYTNNIDLPPLFFAPSEGVGDGYDGLSANWQLQAISPCVNTADTTGISYFLPSVDLAGNPRINGVIDMGAYEYDTGIGIDQTLIEDDISIGPNPSDGNFVITSVQIISTVMLYDVTGRMVYQCNTHQKEVGIDCTHLPKGLYYLRINKESQSFVRKVIID